MKKKLFNTLTLIGFISFALFIGLCLIEFFSFNSLWIKYVLLFSLLLLFIGLSNTFKKFTDYNEGMACLRRAVRSLNVIKGRDIRKINYVRIMSVKNQLVNAKLYIGNVVDKFDLYDLKVHLERLDKIIENYSLAKKEKLNNEVILKDIEDIEQTQQALNGIQSRNVMIK